MDNVTYEAMQERIAKLTVQNKQLARTNSRLNRRNKKLRNIIKQKNKEINQLSPRKKQRYRNGRKRGSHGHGFNG